MTSWREGRSIHNRQQNLNPENLVVAQYARVSMGAVAPVERLAIDRRHYLGSILYRDIREVAKTTSLTLPHAFIHACLPPNSDQDHNCGSGPHVESCGKL